MDFIEPKCCCINGLKMTMAGPAMRGSLTRPGASQTAPSFNAIDLLFEARLSRDRSAHSNACAAHFLTETARSGYEQSKKMVCTSWSKDNCMMHVGCRPMAKCMPHTHTRRLLPKPSKQHQGIAPNLGHPDCFFL